MAQTLSIFAIGLIAAWFPLTFLLAGRLSGTMALTAGLVGGWLLLPAGIIMIPSLPDYTKYTVLSISLVLGLLAFHRPMIRRFRPQWIDLPMLVWCLIPLGSSLRNHLGVYDGLAAVFQQMMIWGIPYLLGRITLTTEEDLTILLKVMVVGAVAYVPLIGIELFAGPVLHRTLYGYQVYSTNDAMRFGGWRPGVFLQHGLMLSLWMAASSVAAVWLASRSGKPRMLWLFVILSTAVVLVKSVNGWALLVMGLVMVWLAQRDRLRVLAMAQIVLIVAYLLLRSTGLWSGMALADAVREINESKGESIFYRVATEELLVARAQEQPLWGWGGWGDQFVPGLYDTLTIPDSLWVLVLGRNGYLGLIALQTALMLPVIRAVAGLWRGHPGARSELVVIPLSIILLMVYTDNLLNAMINPVFTLALGGLLSITTLSGEEPEITSSLAAHAADRAPG